MVRAPVLPRSPSAGARRQAAVIVRDGGFAFWGDEHFQADSTGQWSHSVNLSEGDSQFTFWLDDDSSQTVTIEVGYEPVEATSPPLTMTPAFQVLKHH